MATWRSGNAGVCKTSTARVRFPSAPHMSKESEGGFRKEAGKWAITGGIVAGVIGLVTNPNLAIAAAGLIIGGWILRKD